MVSLRVLVPGGNSSGSSGLGQSAKISYVEKFIGLGKDND